MWPCNKPFSVPDSEVLVFGLDIVGCVFEVQVMDDVYLGHVGMQRQPAVGGKEQVGLDFSQGAGDGVFKVYVPQIGMSRGREEFDGDDVFGEDELFVVLTVEEKIKGVFRMVAHNTLETLAGKPADAFQPVFQQ